MKVISLCYGCETTVSNCPTIQGRFGACMDNMYQALSPRPSELEWRCMSMGTRLDFWGGCLFLLPQNQTNFTLIDTTCATHKLNLIYYCQSTPLNWLGCCESCNKSCLIIHVPISIWGGCTTKTPCFISLHQNKILYETLKIIFFYIGLRLHIILSYT